MANILFELIKQKYIDYLKSVKGDINKPFATYVDVYIEEAKASTTKEELDKVSYALSLSFKAMKTAYGGGVNNSESFDNLDLVKIVTGDGKEMFMERPKGKKL